MRNLDLRDDAMCFACGKKNPDGLHLEFSFENGEVGTSIAFPKKFQGYGDVVHGGLVATVLDEAMVTLLNRMGHLAVTAELTVRFLRPARVGETIRVTARLLKERGKHFRVTSRAVDETGAEIARGEARCISLGTYEPPAPK